MTRVRRPCAPIPSGPSLLRSIAPFLIAAAAACSSGEGQPPPPEAGLAALLDRHAASLQELPAIEEREGTAAALASLRRQHARGPRQPFLRYGLRRMVPERAAVEADATIREGFVLGRHPRFQLEPPVDWAADPFGDRSWRFHLNAWAFLEPVMIAFRETGDRRYVRFAHETALDWCLRNVDEPGANPFAWYDMAVGRRAALLAALLDDALREPSVPARDVIRLLRAAALHVRELVDPDKLAAHSNHGIYQLAGLLALVTTVPELRGSAQHRLYALEELARLFASHFSEEGIHLEHSPAYHLWLTNFLGLVLETGWIPPESELYALFDRALEGLVWMVRPDGIVVRAGDGDRMEAADRILFPANDSLRFVLSRGAEGSPPQRHWAVFDRAGYAIHRSEWATLPWERASFLFFSAAFHSRAHKQADDFSFVWYAAGHPLVVDAGRFAYHYDDPRRQYVESTRAHNTVEIDGSDYTRKRRDAFGSAIRRWGEAADLWFVEAQLQRERDFAMDHRRVIALRPDHWLVVIDVLDSPREHEYTQWFHLHPDLEVERGGERTRIRLPRDRRELVIVPLAPGTGAEIRLVEGQETPRWQGWTSPQANVMEPNPALGFRVHGRRAVFATLLRLGSPGARIEAGEIRIDDDGDLVAWTVEGRREGFRLPPGRAAAPQALEAANR